MVLDLGGEVVSGVLNALGWFGVKFSKDLPGWSQGCGEKSGTTEAPKYTR